MDRLLRPRSVAIIGASDSPGALGASALANLTRLGYRVTAEGVETRAAIDYLSSIGCDHAQGFLIARALASDTVERLFSRREWDFTRAGAKP